MKVKPLSWPSLSSIFTFTNLTLNLYVEGDSKTAGESLNGRDIPRSTLSPVSNAMSQSTCTDGRTIDAVFSDLDGTLIHYPKDIDNFLKQDISKEIHVLPSSSTGMVGVLSMKSLHLVREIRKTGVKFVLISGMRASTILKRLPYLPKADAYCCEAGGRIFYPTQLHSKSSVNVYPKAFPDATPDDLCPFSIVEDLEWRRKMEHVDAAGLDGYIGQDLNSGSADRIIPVTARRGKLWDFARSLSDRGFILDTTGYTTCFRVNRNYQENTIIFDSLINRRIEVPSGLSSSTNLGCVDYYPGLSGKKNCCEYLSKKFASNNEGSTGRCLCLCDDDNDIDMALSCLHTYVPLISSASMEDCVHSHPTKFTVISLSKDSEDGIKATETALTLVLERLKA